MQNWTRIFLVVGIILLVNLLSRQFFFRIDTTTDKQYTLSRATKNILKSIPEPVTITAYFTKDLPQQYLKNYNDFKDLLVEYSVRSKGMVNYEFIDPADDPATEQEAVSNGISPLLINVREKDEVAQKKAFMGALLKSGDQQDVMGYIPPDGALEYMLTTSIKKITSLEKPSIGIVQGYGSPRMDELNLLSQALSIQYNVEPINLASVQNIDTKYKTIALIKPTDTIPPYELNKLSQYVAAGGNICMAINTVEGDFQSVQGRELHTGLENWLAQYGIHVHPNFIVDASAGSITVQQRQGFFTINSSIEFPYFPLVSTFADHPVTEGLEQIIFQFVSQITFEGDSASFFQPLVFSSENTGIQNPPVYFDVQKKWNSSDFTLSSQVLGGILKLNSGASITVFGDGDFVLGAQGRGQTPDNISLFVNAIDFLSDDTGLINLRTKGVTSRPIKELEDGEKATIKWVSFLLPILLILGYGFIRLQQNRNKRIKRMVEQYA